MTIVADNILRRFLAKNVLSDDRFRPPLSVVNAVDEGKLDAHVLLFWKDVVEKISASPQGWKGSPSYGAAISYWRNKCAKNGYPLPKEYLEGQLGGEGAQGRWKLKPGDQVEEWVRQTLYSQGLIATLHKTVAEWQMEIVHLERELQEAGARVEKHKAGLSTAKSPAGVAQKQKWLDGAQKDVEKFGAELDNAQKKLKELVAAADKKPEAANYSIEFEKEFQFMMLVAQKDLDKKGVLESVKKAVERFEQGLAIPDADPIAHDIDRYKNAGMFDFITKPLAKAWEYLKGAFDFFRDWISGIGDTTQKIDQMLKQAGA